MLAATGGELDGKNEVPGATWDRDAIERHVLSDHLVGAHGGRVGADLDRLLATTLNGSLGALADPGVCMGW